MKASLPEQLWNSPQSLRFNAMTTPLTQDRVGLKSSKQEGAQRPANCEFPQQTPVGRARGSRVTKAGR